MKGLLLAGGHGTRLRPLTFTGNKHMIPIANQPMLFYGLRHLAEAGIREVGIVLGPLHEGIKEAVGDGREFGVEVTYIHQGDPRGLADAVRCSRQFLGEDPFVMYLGDNLLQEGAIPFIRRFERDHPEAVIGATRVHDPRSYGVVELREGAIVSIVEKPVKPRSNLALIGVYLFTSRIHEIVESLKPSPRGELEITDAIWGLHRAGAQVAVQELEGWWKDTGRPDDLLEANDRVLQTMTVGHFLREGTIERGATVTGNVSIGAGSTIRTGVSIQGPAVIGRNCEIATGSKIGPTTAIGDRVRVDGVSIRRSIILEGAELRGPVQIENSIIGRDSRIGSSAYRGSLSCILGDATLIRL